MSDLSNTYGFKCSKCGGENSVFSAMTDIHDQKYYSMICPRCGNDFINSDVVNLAFCIISKCYVSKHGRVVYLSHHSKKSRVRKKNFNRIKREIVKDVLDSFKRS